MLKILSFIGYAVGGLAGLGVFAYLFVLGINWTDRPPNDAYLKLAALVDERPPVADEDNAALDALGFSVAGTADPRQVGTAIRDWMEAVGRDASAFDSQPEYSEGNFGEAQIPAVYELSFVCASGASSDCRKRFDQLAAGIFTSQERLLLARYRILLRHPVWREPIPADPRLPMPMFGAILHAQRAYLLQLRSQARPGAALEIRQALHAEHEFWREVQRSCDLVMTKVAVVAALRQHFFLGNLVVRALPPDEQLAALPEGWGRALSPQELDMHQLMAGELRWMERMMHFEPQSQGIKWRLQEALMRPLYQPQDTNNHLAERYLSFASRFQVSLSEYPKAEAMTNRNEAPAAGLWSLYNPMGQAVNRIDWFFDLPMRVAALEGIRRAALLTTQLRSRGVAPAQVAAELDQAELREPFGGQAFRWSESDSAVVYDSPDQTTSSHHVYFY